MLYQLYHSFQQNYHEEFKQKNGMKKWPWPEYLYEYHLQASLEMKH